MARIEGSGQFNFESMGSNSIKGKGDAFSLKTPEDQLQKLQDYLREFKEYLISPDPKISAGDLQHIKDNVEKLMGTLRPEIQGPVRELLSALDKGIQALDADPSKVQSALEDIMQKMNNIFALDPKKAAG